jgi:hypothetical protein
MDAIDRMSEDEVRAEVRTVHGWSSTAARIGGDGYCLVFAPVQPTPDAPRWEACGNDVREAYATALRALRAGKHKQEA